MRIDKKKEIHCTGLRISGVIREERMIDSSELKFYTKELCGGFKKGGMGPQDLNLVFGIKDLRQLRDEIEEIIENMEAESRDES